MVAFLIMCAEILGIYVAMHVGRKAGYDKGYFDGYAECMDQWQRIRGDMEPPF